MYTPRSDEAPAASVAPLQADAAQASAPRDSDQDGLSDRLERRTDTDPFDRDSDGDGKSDGQEDQDGDGVIDRGESDPRTPGLFPATAPHIPEPLVFDLVRGLGSRRGELEVNTLAVIGLRDGRVHWAPEVERAFARGHAVELELPMLDRHVEAVKLAVQGTFPSRRKRIVHGWQTFGEVALDGGVPRGVLLYILGHRFAKRWSYLAMLGGDAVLPEFGQRRGAVLLNGSLFADPVEWATVGLEGNLSVGLSGQWRVAVFPQAHFQVGKRLRVQLAPGMGITPAGVEPLAALRVILE